MTKNIKDEEILYKLQELLSQKLKIKKNEIDNISHLADDLGVDSVDFWEVIAKVEQEFGIQVVEEDLKSIYTVQDVINFIKKKLK